MVNVKLLFNGELALFTHDSKNYVLQINFNDDDWQADLHLYTEYKEEVLNIAQCYIEHDRVYYNSITHNTTVNNANKKQCTELENICLNIFIYICTILFDNETGEIHKGGHYTNLEIAKDYTTL